MAYANPNAIDKFETMQTIKQMVGRFENHYNRYLTLPRYQPTPEEAEIVSQIIADFEANPDSLPLCENGIDNLIGDYCEEYYSGEDIRAKIISALIISQIKGVKALFVYKSPRVQKIHWYVTKNTEMMRRAVASNLVAHGTPGGEADEESNRIIKVITDTTDTLMAVVFIKGEGFM